jgi:sodium-dependent dicarboxylate transporter 2/3/5
VPNRPDESERRPTPVQTAALGLGPLLFALTFALPAPAGMPATAWHVAGLALWMAVWWSAEAIPVPVTALLPIVVVPFLGVFGVSAAAAPYANPLIFLFLGGFVLALGIQRWNLHRRIALLLIVRLGTRPASLVASFMAATALLSMWVSNTATAMLMLPIALSVIAVVGDASKKPGAENPFAAALLLGVAYGASIGGMATLIGTPPNALLAAFAQERLGARIGFAQWMAVGVPVALLLGICAWLVLTRVAFRLSGAEARGAVQEIRAGLGEMGRMGPAERRVAVIFAVTAVAWLAQPLIARIPLLDAITDTSIALVGGMSLFLVPAGAGASGRLLSWEVAAKLPWGTLILVGGGLSLAEAITQSGLALWIGSALGIDPGWSAVAMVAVVAAIVVFLTEMTSNTATTAAFLPVMASLAGAMGVDPMMLMAPVALAASAAFMLPVATPPNAIVYASGRIAIAHMARAGILLNLATIFVLTLLLPHLVPSILAR